MNAQQPATGPTRAAEIRISQLTKTYTTDAVAHTAVDRVDLDVPAGQYIALTGPSGSGKSTLLYLIGALEAADAGTIHVDALEVTALPRRQLPAYRSTVGFVFQRYNLLPALTVLDNVLVPVLPVRTDFDKTDRARSLVARVGLADREDALPGRLSGGEQQRVAIARALINHPRLLLADEPTGNLDSKTGAEVLDLMAELQQTGMTIIIATHDPLVAARAHRTVHLLDGKISDPAL